MLHPAHAAENKQVSTGELVIIYMDLGFNLKKKYTETHPCASHSLKVSHSRDANNKTFLDFTHTLLTTANLKTIWGLEQDQFIELVYSLC